MPDVKTRQLTAFRRWIDRIDMGFLRHDQLHRLGERATHPIEPRCGALAALRLLGGSAGSVVALAGCVERLFLG